MVAATVGLADAGFAEATTDAAAAGFADIPADPLGENVVAVPEAETRSLTRIDCDGCDDAATEAEVDAAGLVPEAPSTLFRVSSTSAAAQPAATSAVFTASRGTPSFNCEAMYSVSSA